MAQIPQHPGRNQQGLGSPTGNEQPQQIQPASGLEFYTPSSSLGAYNAKAQEAVNLANANKANTEAQLLQQMQAGPTVQPEEVQAGQLQEGILTGQITPDSLRAMIANGEVSERTAQAAVAMAREYKAKDDARLEQSMGLGAL